MHPIVQDKLETLKELCAKHRVGRLDIFGSAARKDFNPESSDLDFLVEYDAMSPVEQRRIDLLEREPIENPYLWESIARSRRVLYEAA